MNNVAVITDPHFGIKKANDLFLNSQLKFFKEQLVPSLEEHNIKEIFFLGDIFDNRVSMNIKIKNAVLDVFENILSDYKIYILIGNHDCYFNNSIETNAVKFLNKFNNIKVISKSSIIKSNDRTIYMVPWIVDSERFRDEVSNLKDRVDICMGHFAINGFHLNKFKIQEDAMSHEEFNKFSLVFSGHLHQRGIKIFGDTEIAYIGSPFQLTRADSGEPRGYCVLDMDTLKYKFIDNDQSLEYIQINYPDSFTEEMINGNIVDVNVKFDKSTDDSKVQEYIKEIEMFNPIIPPSIIAINSFMNTTDTDGDFEIKSKSELIREYVNALDINNKDEIFAYLETLYEEAKNTL